jgi:pimeloyl-ACP methyl ester carboxylesterase
MDAVKRSFAALALLLAALPTGCMFVAAHQQQVSLDALCQVSGHASAAGKDASPIVVVLLRRDEAAKPGDPLWRIADHFVLEEPGAWTFGAGPGRYAVVAFLDRSRDLVYNQGERYLAHGAEQPLVCKDGSRLAGIDLVIPEKVDKPLPRSVDIPKLQRRDAEGQFQATMGQLTAVGEIVTLADKRFSQQNAEDGLWRPYDFLSVSRPGIYFLEPYDPKRIPVLFVHGINGTPASFDYLIGRLDTSRFQPWVYYYPSGAHLTNIANHFDQTMAKLQVRYGFSRFAVVAHSMGGLVSRGFVLRRAQGAQASAIPLFITISTPWGGHKAAEFGVKTSPVVVRVWEDMLPGSPYQRSLYEKPLPEATKHYLVFTYKGTSSGTSGDGAVSVASQLLPQAQREAVKLYGFDETHTSVLRNAQVSLLLNQLLAETFR